MAVNVVTILVRARNETQAAFAEVDASAGGMSKAVMLSGAAIAVAAAGIGYEALKMATTWQSSMEKLVTQAGVPAPKLAVLKQGILALAGQVGFSPDSLAASAYHVASAMQSMGGTAQQMLNVVKVAAEGARVGGANLTDVTNALTSAVASGIPGAKNYAQAMGMINATVGSGDMTMQDYADAMSTGLLPVMKQYGLTLLDVGAALATYGDLNIRGSDAATKLRMAVMSMAAPTAQGKKDFAAMGMSVNQLGTDMRTGGLMKALQDILKHYAAIGIKGKKIGAQLTEDFGKKAGVGLAVLLGNMPRLGSKFPDLIKGAHDFGAAWAATHATLSQKLAELRGKFDAVMISIGTRLLPAATRLAGFILTGLIPAIGRIVSWMARNRDAIIAVAAGIMAVLVPALAEWAAEALAAAAATLAAAAPYIAVAAGIALVVYAILQLAKHWKRAWHDIKAWFDDAFNWIKSHWRLILEILTGPVGAAVAFIVSHWRQVTDGARRMWNDVVSFFKRLPGDIVRALGNLGHLLWNAGVSIVKGLLGGITSMWGAVRSVAGGLASKFAGFFGLSPAREGPLSGPGAPRIRGQHLVADIAAGMLDARGSVAAAAAAVAGIAGPGYGYGGGMGGAGGGGVLRLQVTGGGAGLDHLFIEWLRNQVRVLGGGGPGSAQRALGRS